MNRHPRLATGAATAALAISALGISAGSAAAATRHPATARAPHSLVGGIGGVTGTLLGSVSSSVGSLTGSGLTTTIASDLHLTGTTQAALTKDMSAYAASGSGEKGLGPLLTELSEAPGISGTQFGDDLSTLGTNLSNESGTSWQNFVDGANKLAQESSSFPAPFNVFFYNLSQGLLKLYYN